MKIFSKSFFAVYLIASISTSLFGAFDVETYCKRYFNDSTSAKNIENIKDSLSTMEPQEIDSLENLRDSCFCKVDEKYCKSEFEEEEAPAPVAVSEGNDSWQSTIIGGVLTTIVTGVCLIGGRHLLREYRIRDAVKTLQGMQQGERAQYLKAVAALNVNYFYDKEGNGENYFLNRVYDQYGSFLNAGAFGNANPSVLREAVGKTGIWISAKWDEATGNWLGGKVQEVHLQDQQWAPNSKSPNLGNWGAQHTWVDESGGEFFAGNCN